MNVSTVSIDEVRELRQRIKALESRCRKRALSKNQRAVIIACLKHVAPEVSCGGGMSSHDQAEMRKVYWKLKV